jgi:hypothetical protein
MFRNLILLTILGLLMLPLPATALEQEDLLSLIAMPLAVAAVSEVTDVPMSQLIDVVTLLNDAAVPPAQFVEVVRYIPVALLAEADEPVFVDWLRQEYSNGVREVALVSSIEERLQVYDLRDLELERTPIRVIEVVESPVVIPAVVTTRLASRGRHPHGGPPGQLKKELGLKTGAEVVHGSRHDRDDDKDAAARVVGREGDRGRKVARDDDSDSERNARRGGRDEVRVKEDKERKEPKAKANRGKGNDRGRDKGKGHD